jgi:hypothetical protein
MVCICLLPLASQHILSAYPDRIFRQRILSQLVLPTCLVNISCQHILSTYPVTKYLVNISCMMQPPKHQLHRQVVESGAHWLRHKLQLRFFGFDVVVDQHTGEAFFDWCASYRSHTQDINLSGLPYPVSIWGPKRTRARIPYARVFSEGFHRGLQQLQCESAVLCGAVEERWS